MVAAGRAAPRRGRRSQRRPDDLQLRRRDLPRDDTGHLELLYRYGFGGNSPSPWRERLGSQLHAPSDLVAEVLQHAAEHDLRRRAALVLGHGADPDRRARHPVFGGRTPLQSALRRGNLAVARQLEAAGADTSVVDVELRLQSVLLSGDEPAAQAAAADRTAVDRLRDGEPRLVIDAPELRRTSAVALLVELGWDVNGRGRGTALQCGRLGR